MIRRAFLILCASAVFIGCGAKPAEPDAVYYLVRHAEKTAETSDPALTIEGKQRAQDLTERLKTVPVTMVYSSDYKRTRDTAAPIAAAKGLEVELYDPRDLEGLAKTLLSEKGHILVVGHSNTTPQLSALLGGPEGEPIVEATEYNRLYVLEKTHKGISGRIEKYGD